jgi:hypothetical protein
LEAICFTEIFIGIKMNSNQANESDGSFHIRVNPLPVKKKPKSIPEEVETKKEVKKNDKKDRK